MKRLKGIKQVKKGDYIKAFNSNGKFIVFKANNNFSYNTTYSLIVDTDISGLETMIGKTEHLSRYSLDNEFKLYRLNKMERWVYEI